MMKQGNTVTYVRQGVAINALVAASREVYTPATQETPAFTTEHLDVVYLEPGAGSSSMSGQQLRDSIKTQFSVPPLTPGAVNGWSGLPPAHETKTYPDGTTVTGPGPLPDLSPAQQDSQPTTAAPADVEVPGLTPTADGQTPTDGQVTEALDTIAAETPAA